MNTTTITESATVTVSPAIRPRAKRIRRKPETVDAATAPRLKDCLATGQFVGIRAEKTDGTPRTYCAHKPYLRHLSGNRKTAELTAKPQRAKTEKEKAMVVFSEANLDGIRAIAGSARVFRITHDGKTWTLNQSEYDHQRAEFARQNAEPIESVVSSALAECLKSDQFPADFFALL
jgi:hypothetical protein